MSGKGVMMHTKGPWRAVAHPNLSMAYIVADEPTPDGVRADPSILGGHLIAEAVAPSNAPLIAAAPDLYDFAVWVRDEVGKWNPGVLAVANEVLKKAGEGK